MTRRRDAFGIALASVVLALVMAPTAGAQTTTIGSSLAADPNLAPLCDATCTVMQEGLTAGAVGVITRWRVKVGTPVTPMRLQVLRAGMEVATSATVTPVARTTNVFPTRLAIAVGDTIGVACCDNDAVIVNGGGTPPAVVFDPALPSPATAAPLAGELLVNADIEPDADEDDFGDESQDNCRGVANSGQENSDGDALGNACDNCPAVTNPGQQDLDHDQLGDACDTDLDGDNVLNVVDNCDTVVNSGQQNLDGDGFGDACDGDRDGDGRANGADNCPSASNAGQQDLDRDRVGDACDPDRDGDGLANGVDVCPSAFGFKPRGCPTPPVVRFKTPLAGSGIGPTAQILLEVADDRGSPTVSVFDDDGTICVLHRAPYVCTWHPTGADVGRATLVASAVDSDRMNALAVVRVRVERFEARLTRKVRRRGSRIKVTGRLVLPDVVEPELGCTGNVTVKLRRVKRKVELGSRCRYSTRLPNRRGKPRVSFGGNEVIEPT